jgi:uncharacterized protein (TIGR02246 family)
MRILQTLGLLALLGSAWGCASGGHALDRPSDDVDLRKVLTHFMDALNSCDLERTMALFSPDATMFFPLPETALRAESREEIATVFKDFYAQVRAGNPGPRCMALEPHDVRFQRFGDGAVISFQIAKGPLTSRRSMTLRRSDGRWQIIHFHASNVRKDPEE